jgi:preprotein translocase subunit SecB
MTEQSKTNNVDDGPQFAILRVYMKDVSFETPNSPAVLTQQLNQDVKIQIDTTVNQLESDLYEVILAATVTARQSENTAYLAEVHQAGLFAIKGFEDAQLAAMLGAYCPNTLFPFAREAVADLVAKGGFPQLLLAPVNFDALYAEKSARMKQQAAAAEPGAR